MNKSFSSDVKTKRRHFVQEYPRRLLTERDWNPNYLDFYWLYIRKLMEISVE